MRYRMPDISKRLVAAYIFDWIVIIVLLLISYGLNFLTPRYHLFSIVNLDISYPYEPEIFKTAYLVLASVILPAIIIVLVSILLVPGPSGTRRASWSTLLKLKLWEFNVGWLGLALSLATALLITQGLKNIIGKPRPDLLSRCNPDVNNIAAHTVASYAANFSPEWVLVNQTICQQTDKSVLNDGFRSFPSGHSSTSWAGLLYLSLYLCSKFAVVFPYPQAEAMTEESSGSSKTMGNHARAETSESQRAIFGGSGNRSVDYLAGGRHSAAAAPLWTLFLLYVPIGVAIYICASRYFQYYHHGFDVIAGALIGAATSYFSFRFYHMPLTRGSGWSWGPRSPDRAFGVGVGSHGYVDEQRQMASEDLEMGSMLRNGVQAQEHRQYDTSQQDAFRQSRQQHEDGQDLHSLGR